jgi:hypothetical protein
MVPNPIDDNNFWKEVVLYLLRGKTTKNTELKVVRNFVSYINERTWTENIR